MQRDTLLVVENMFSLIVFIQLNSVHSCGKPVRFHLLIPFCNFLSLSMSWLLGWNSAILLSIASLVRLHIDYGFHLACPPLLSLALSGKLSGDCHLSHLKQNLHE